MARQLSVAQAALEAQLARDPGDDRALQCLARVVLERDDRGRAVELLEKAVAKRPESAEHHTRLGLALRLQGARAGMPRAPSLFARMKTELETALALDSSQADAHYTLLLFYAQVPEVMGGGIGKARALAANPDHVEAGKAIAGGR